MKYQDIEGGAKPAPNFWTRARAGFGAPAEFGKPMIPLLFTFDERGSNGALPGLLFGQSALTA